MTSPVPEDEAGIHLVRRASGGCFLVHLGTGEVLAANVERQLHYSNHNAFLHKDGLEPRWCRQGLLTLRLMQAPDGRM